MNSSPSNPDPQVPPSRRGIVVGASSGIGLAVVRALARDGVSVHALSRSEPAAPEASADWLRCDVRDFDSVRAAFQAVRASGPVDFVVNAAGVGFFAPLDDDRREQWAAIIDTNLTGLVHVLAAVRMDLPDLDDLVQIGSMAAHRPSRTPGNAIYAATKAGGRALVEAYRTDLRAAGNSMRVSMVSPGFVRATGFGEHYFDASPDVAHDLFATNPSLTADDVASAVVRIVGLPAGVEVGDLILRAQMQPD